MGDSSRAVKFADWISRNFPVSRFPTVADIAGGNGDVARQLTARGYTCTVFEQKKSTFKPSVRIDAGEAVFEVGQFHLIVGMHPDGATWHIIRLAKEAQAAFALVPCCEIPPRGRKRPAGMLWKAWLEHEAHNFGFQPNRGLLSMQGENTIIYAGRPR